MTTTSIMIVEDERIVAMDIKSSLENLGYSVSAIAASGETALERVAETQPDLVLMDIQLKGEMDGVKAAEQIRDNFNIPVIYLTANADNQTLQRAKITEPYGYILKPFEEKELNISIEMAMYKHQSESQVKAREQWYATTLKSIGDAAIAVDNRNSLVFINTAAETLTGWQETEALGKNLSEVFHLLHQETLEQITDLVKTNQAGGAISLPDDTVLVTKSGKLLAIAGSAALIRNNQENIVGAILMFRTKDAQQIKFLQQATSQSSSTTIDDKSLIQTFVEMTTQGQAILLRNLNLRTETVADTIQLLLGKTEGLIAKAMLAETPRSILVKKNSRYWELIHQAMFSNNFFPIGQVQDGVYRYQSRPMPENYQMHCTDAMELWKIWLARIPGSFLDIIILKQGSWHQVTDLKYSYGKTLYVKTLDDKVAINGTEALIWGRKLEKSV